MDSKGRERKMTTMSNFTIVYYYYPPVSDELLRKRVVLLKF